MVDMTTIDHIYEIPNIGCLLGIAYQAEAARLASALSEAGLDITAAEYVILRTLYAQGSLQQCELARILIKDKASVSRGVQSLARKELVEASPVSHKCTIVSLTEKGESMKPQLLGIAKKMHKGLAEKITKPQMENLREILELIINSN